MREVIMNPFPKKKHIMEKELLQYKRPGCKIIVILVIYAFGGGSGVLGVMVACRFIGRCLCAGIILKRECVEMAAVMLP
jgi:predicted cation transporter